MVGGPLFFSRQPRKSKFGPPHWPPLCTVPSGRLPEEEFADFKIPAAKTRTRLSPMAGGGGPFHFFCNYCVWITDCRLERDGAAEWRRGWDDDTAKCSRKAVTDRGGVVASHDVTISPWSRNRRPASPTLGRHSCDLGHQSKQRSWLPNL